jgi:hypothetical protein
MLGVLVAELAQRSTSGALYFFSSAQLSFVEAHDPDYLDARRRGHIVAWSIDGTRRVFSPAGFNIIPLPGRDWALLAEFGPERAVPVDDLISWLWHPVPENLALWRNDVFGPLFETIGLESARCYFEAAIADGRGRWAQALESQIRAAAIRVAPDWPPRAAAAGCRGSDGCDPAGGPDTEVKNAR